MFFLLFSRLFSLLFLLPSLGHQIPTSSDLPPEHQIPMSSDPSPEHQIPTSSDPSSEHQIPTSLDLSPGHQIPGSSMPSPRHQLPDISAPSPTPPDDSTQIIDWLTRYGYLPPPDPATGKLQTWEAVTNAIRSMQEFAGIQVTGIVDEETVILMKTPRCSLPDINRQMDGTERRKRSLGAVWKRRNLSWKLRNYPKHSHLGRETIRVLSFYALKVWSDPTPLNFHEVAGHSPDITIDFLQGDHGDGYPFDGPGGMVAHAFFPGNPQQAGNVHFDSDELWTFRSPEDHGTDLFAVAVHEFGHALGLSHSPLKKSIMRPYYQGPVGDPLQYQLSPDDRNEIRQLYGGRELAMTEVPEVMTPKPPDLPHVKGTHRPRKDIPDRCSSTFDAVTQIRGETFFFKGRYFWRLTQARHLTSFHPAQIQHFWRGLPSRLRYVDAVYERFLDHRILFFQGSQYWVFKDNALEEGYPRSIMDFGLPEEGIDGAFSCPHDAKTFFFKDGQHWRYDETETRMDPGYPLENGPLPSNIDDVTSGTDGSVYFFKGREYWTFIGVNFMPGAGYPRSIATDWMDCTMDLEATYTPLETGFTLRADAVAKVPEEKRSWDHHLELDVGTCVCQMASAATETWTPPLLVRNALLVCVVSLELHI
ncbi:matrix metalloproteinase-17-like [Latimeria chalumnae]|uniref:matrix metalloproteinase-17-like n=1 Tax=Latimeria chalumnae TaxID=7897 RepID=UPI00313E47A3